MALLLCSALQVSAVAAALLSMGARAPSSVTLELPQASSLQLAQKQANAIVELVLLQHVAAAAQQFPPTVLPTSVASNQLASMAGIPSGHKGCAKAAVPPVAGPS